MLQRTRWSPDTCRCVVEYSYDTDNQTFSDVVVVRACPDHGTILQAAKHFTEVLAENQLKNEAVNLARTHIETVFEKPPDGVTFGFGVTGKRLLRVVLPGHLTRDEKIDVDKNIKAQFPGRKIR